MSLSFVTENSGQKVGCKHAFITLYNSYKKIITFKTFIAKKLSGSPLPFKDDPGRLLFRENAG
jgi:hypothetical protein